MGNNNKIHQGAVIAALPQDFEFRGEKSECVIGNNNIIRENVVINRATHQGGQTVIGNDNFLMEGSHISHDTKVGNCCVFGYGTKIAGDCIIEDSVIFSTSVVENPKTRVGMGSMIQAGTTFSKDVPPYIIVTRRRRSSTSPTPIVWCSTATTLCMMPSSLSWIRCHPVQRSTISWSSSSRRSRVSFRRNNPYALPQRPVGCLGLGVLAR